MRRDLAHGVAQLAWPAILQGLLTTVIFFTDRLLLGTYSDEALGSMQVSGPVLWSVFSVAGAFAAGTMAVVGRAVGARDPERARAAVMTALRLAVGLGILIGVVGWATRVPVADLLGGGFPPSLHPPHTAIPDPSVPAPAGAAGTPGRPCNFAPAQPQTSRIFYGHARRPRDFAPAQPQAVGICRRPPA